MDGSGPRELLDRVGPQGADPVEAGPAQVLLDPLAGDHAPVADEHHPPQAEALPDLGDLGGEGGGVGGVAGENLDGHRPALAVAEQPVDDPGQPAFAVAGIAVGDQGGLAPGVVAPAEVVEQQGALREVALGELVLDAALAGQEPVEGFIKLAVLDLAEAEFPAEGAGGGFGAEAPGAGELGSGLEEALDEHGQDEVALAGGAGGQEVVEADPAEEAEEEGDVSVGEGAEDLPSVGGRGAGAAVLEALADGLDEVAGEMGDVAEGLVLDLAVLAVSAAEEMGSVGLALVDASGGGYMYRSISSWHSCKIATTARMSTRKSIF